MTRWTPVNDKEKYGVAIYNFKDDKIYSLQFSVGDTVRILQENEGWYYGYLTKNRSAKGVFPKTYIHIKEPLTDRNGVHEVVVAKEDPILQEVTSTLREWGFIWKQLYVNHSKDFEKIRNMMYDLIDYHRNILSGTLPVDELKELKQKVTCVMDLGNRILGLDLVVRDDHGNILNPDVSSAVHLYSLHEQATQRLQKTELYTSQKSVTRYSHSLYVSLKNCVCKIGEDAELLMTLYDAKENKFISENYLVKWAKEGLAWDLDQMNNLRVLFTDLGSRDLSREKVYLVCQIIRVGFMELKDADHRKSVHSNRKPFEGIRRPFGLAGMDITDFITCTLESDEEKQHFVPFIQCGDRDFLDNMIKKVITMKEVSQKDHKGQGLWVSVKLLHGDLKQVREENPHLISITTAIARKMGFPEIILPGDVRNDLYLTLVQGEFPKGNKTSDKNVEVTVKVCNEKGVAFPSVITLGAGGDPVNEYRSVIYYHEDKPKWYETFKITLPIEDFSNSHLKFVFKHRSSNYAKDKIEKPFAMSYVKLRQDNGTTLKDECHDLLVYKVDYKKFEEGDSSYLTLPSTKHELERYQGINNHQTSKLNLAFQSGGLSLSSKDSFQISTLVCSTKLTQNVDLLGLLKWSDNQDNLKNNLLAFMKVDGEEVVKFLQDVLDALFNILIVNNDSSTYDNLVFEALVFIIGLISDRKYLHFRPVLDVYIEETFSATLAYTKLMEVLKCLLDNTSVKDGQDPLLRTMKSLEYIFKFIVRSRVLFAQLNEDKEQKQFESMLKQLLQSITGMMSDVGGSTLLVQGACLKYLPTAITDILKVFDSKELSYIFTDFINNVPLERLTKQKMMCVNDVVFSDLFKIPECRLILLPVFNEHIRFLLNKGEEIELCVKILSDILEVLHRPDVGETHQDISDIMLCVLRTVIQTVIKMDRSSPLVGNLVAVMISILRQMTPYHYNEYIQQFTHRTDLLDFLMEILLVFQDLVTKNVYPKDWNEMIMLQNSVVLKALRAFSHTIRDKFFNPFEYQVWNNFFHCAISFLTQKGLQLENFSQNKLNKIISQYGDMRRETGFEIRSMWFNLLQQKIQFVPGMVGRFLEMTLIPETELREATIPIFFDMMQCEFYSSRHSVHNSEHDDHHHHHHIKEIKGNFSEFENEMVTQLDVLVEGGRGDEQYKTLFHDIISDLCKKHSALPEQGLRFVKTVTCLMERLLEYRTIINDENKENRMNCTVNLLEFYNSINRKEMYIRYLYKLCDLHLDCDNYSEAAFTLTLHTKLLKWSDDPLPHILKNDKYPSCETHRELKERLYKDIIEYFDKGKLWEAGLIYCRELAFQYENEIFDYIQLSALLKQMSQFYDNIMKQMRPEPEYFRVGYYGLGFPTFLQNKVFVYRGKEYERLSDFSARLQNQFPNAKLMTKLSPPSEEITNSSLQYLQINKVDPIMEEKKFVGKSVHDQILKYYKVNDVQKFTFSRPLRKGDLDSDNEFATLWLERTNLETTYPLPGILRWLPVKSTVSFEVSPLENAIETVEATNKKLLDLIIAHRMDSNLPINPLSMHLNGVVDAAVMGGIGNYEKAFFNEEYLQKNVDPKEAEKVQKLKEVIAVQIPLLESGIAVHRMKAPDSLRPFHERMEECFLKLKNHVEEKYGKKVTDAADSKILTEMRRVKSLLPKHTSKDRHTDITLNIPDGSTLKPPILNFVSRQSSIPSSKISPRAQSVFVRPSSPSLGKSTLKRNKDSSVQRRTSLATNSLPNEAQSQSQWYDNKPETPTTPIIELNEPLTPHRPLRTEVEKRLSRPTSGHFRQFHNNPSPTRLSISPTPSLVTINSSSTEDIPPPLPQKQCYADYSNFNEDTENYFTQRKSSLPATLIRRKKPPPPLPAKERTPPTPPKKSSARPSTTSSVTDQ